MPPSGKGGHAAGGEYRRPFGRSSPPVKCSPTAYTTPTRSSGLQVQLAERGQLQIHIHVKRVAFFRAIQADGQDVATGFDQQLLATWSSGPSVTSTTLPVVTTLPVAPSAGSAPALPAPAGRPCRDMRFDLAFHQPAEQLHHVGLVIPLLRIANSPQNTPTIEQPFSSARFSGIFGISPAAKPTTR